MTLQKGVAHALVSLSCGDLGIEYPNQLLKTRTTEYPRGGYARLTANRLLAARLVYSARSASIGSTRAARNAGTADANSATRARPAAIATNVGASVALTP
jgi:hypothetical protein